MGTAGLGLTAHVLGGDGSRVEEAKWWLLVPADSSTSRSSFFLVMNTQRRVSASGIRHDRRPGELAAGRRSDGTRAGETRAIIEPRRRKRSAIWTTRKPKLKPQSVLDIKERRYRVQKLNKKDNDITDKILERNSVPPQSRLRKRSGRIPGKQKESAMKQRTDKKERVPLRRSCGGRRAEGKKGREAAGGIQPWTEMEEGRGPRRSRPGRETKASKEKRNGPMRSGTRLR